MSEIPMSEETIREIDEVIDSFTEDETERTMLKVDSVRERLMNHQIHFLKQVLDALREHGDTDDLRVAIARIGEEYDFTDLQGGTSVMEAIVPTPNLDSDE